MILEASRPAVGASGKAGGLIATWAFPQQIVGLSFNLHQELADLYNGGAEWDYRRLRTVSVSGNVWGSKGKRNTKTAKNNLDNSNLPEDLQWLYPEVVEEWDVLGHESDTAQVHPLKFTTAILKRAVEAGAELVIGKVSHVRTNRAEEAVGVLYSTNKQEASGSGSNIREESIDSTRIVLTMGPWTSRILPSCPISGLRTHSITIRTEKPLPPCGVFTELRTSHSGFATPEVYPRKDEVYVCGEGDRLAQLPETAEEVEVVREKCDELFQHVTSVSPALSRGRVLRRQACYLPIVDIPSCSGPFIGETNVPGLYLASGHSCWGINNAPATGKLMAEIIFEGEAKSASLVGLQPTEYFDATDVISTRVDNE